MSVHNLQATNDPQEGGKFTTTLDSGANCHTAATKKDLHAYQPLKRGDFNVKCANGNVVSALGYGTKYMVIQTIDSKNKNSKTILLKAEKVYHLPNFAEVLSTKRLMAENLLAYHCEPGGTGILKSRLGHTIKLQETADIEYLVGTALPPNRPAKTGQAFSIQQDSITLPDNLHHANANTKGNRACVEINKLNEKEYKDLLKESNEETIINDILSQCDREGSRRYLASCALMANNHYTVSSHPYDDFQLLHHASGHRSIRTTALFIKRANIKMDKLHTRQFISKMVCAPCSTQKSKTAGVPTGRPSKVQKRTTTGVDHPFQFVSTDIYGPMPASTHTNQRYLVGFSCRKTNHFKIYPMHSISEVYAKTEEYINWVTTIQKQTVQEINFNRPGGIYSPQGINGPQTIMTDSAAYYKSNRYRDIVSAASHGTCRVIHSSPYRLSDNSRVERSWQTCAQSAACMRAACSLSEKFWLFSMLHAAKLMNVMPTASNQDNNSPYTEMYGKHPTKTQVAHLLKPFGCIAYIHVNKNKRKKTQQRAIPGIYVGYCERSSAYMVYVPRKRTTPPKLLYSASVSFDVRLPDAVGKTSKTKTLHDDTRTNADVRPNITINKNKLEHAIKHAGAQTVAAALRKGATADDVSEVELDGATTLIDYQRLLNEEDKANRDSQLQSEHHITDSNIHKDNNPTQGQKGYPAPEVELEMQATADADQPVKEKWYKQIKNKVSRSGRKIKPTTNKDYAYSTPSNGTTPYTEQEGVTPITAPLLLIDEHPEDTINIDEINRQNYVQNLITMTHSKNKAAELGIPQQAPIQIRQYQVKDLAQVNGVVNKIYKNWKDTQASPLADGFKESAKREQEQLLQQGTFSVHFESDAPEDALWLTSNMCHKSKTNPNGDISKLKSRWNLGGHHERVGVHAHAEHCTAPTPSMTTIRIQYADAAAHGDEAETGDITAAYLKSPKSPIPGGRTIWFTAPRGQEEYKINPKTGRRERLVYRLIKNMYGSITGAHAWYTAHSEWITQEMNMRPNEADPCCYHTKSTDPNERLTVVIYVDDYSITGTPHALEKFKKAANKKWGDCGFEKARSYLAMDITKLFNKEGKPDGYHLCMASYLQSVHELFAKKYKIPNKDIPLPQGYVINKQECCSTDTEPNPDYRKLVGSLQYAQATTWAHAFAQCQIARVQANSGEPHMKIALQVLGNAYKLRHYGPAYRPGDRTHDIDLQKKKDKQGKRQNVSHIRHTHKDTELHSYCDSSHANQPGICPCAECEQESGITYLMNDAYKTSISHVHMYCNAPVAWKAGVTGTRQHNSTESEIIACTEGSKKLICIKRLLENWGTGRPQGAVRVYSDNAACVMVCTKKFETRHSSHIPKLQLIARDRHATGEISIHKVFTTWNPADLGTKALCASQFMTHVKAWMETHVPPHQIIPSAKVYMPKHKYDALMGNPWQNMNIKSNPFRQTVPKATRKAKAFSNIRDCNPFRTQVTGNPFREVHSHVQGERNQGGRASEPTTALRMRGKQAATTECATCKKHTHTHNRTCDKCNAPTQNSKAKRGNPFKDNANPSRTVRQKGNATMTSTKSQKGSAATPRGGHTVHTL
jgi:hypothetical protein